MNQNIDTHLLAKLGTFRQIEIFLKVVEVGGIALAAEKLFLTQPAVSIQLKRLTEAVGVPLYEIIGRTLHITEAGELVAKAGNDMLRTLDHLNTQLNDLKGLQTGALRLAVDSSAKYFLPRLLAPFCKRYPGIEVRFEEGSRRELLRRLQDNLDDLYIFNNVPTDLDIIHRPFLPNPLVVAANKQHRFANGSPLQWQQLSSELLLVRDHNSGSRDALNSLLEQQGWKLGRHMSLASSEAIRLAIMADMGIGILSAYALVNAESDGLVQLKVEGFPIITRWHTVYLKQKKLSKVAQAFLDFMEQEGTQHLPMEVIKKRVKDAKVQPKS